MELMKLVQNKINLIYLDKKYILNRELHFISCHTK